MATVYFKRQPHPQVLHLTHILYQVKQVRVKLEKDETILKIKEVATHLIFTKEKKKRVKMSIEANAAMNCLSQDMLQKKGLL